MADTDVAQATERLRKLAKARHVIKRGRLAKYIHPENLARAISKGVPAAALGSLMGYVNARAPKGEARKPTQKERFKSAAKHAAVLGGAAAVSAGLYNKLERANLAYHINKRRNMLRKESMDQAILDILNGTPVDDVVTRRSLTDDELTESPLAIFAAASGLGAVYDLIKSRGLGKDQEYVVNAIKNGKKVRSKEFVKKIDPTIKVLTNRNEIKRALSQEPTLSDFEINVTTEVIVDAITHGYNAFAMPGDKGMYVFVSKMCNADVIAHEVGHILDFRKKGITISDMKEYDQGYGLLQQWWKPTFKKTTLNAEQAAWNLAPGESTEERKKLEKAAIGTYEKSFHRIRGKRMGAAAIMALLNDLAHRFTARGVPKQGRMK